MEPENKPETPLTEEGLAWTPTSSEAVMTVLGFPVHLTKVKVGVHPYATWGLLLLMVLGTILPMIDHTLIYQYGFVPDAPFVVSSWITAIFLHSGLLHLLFNAYCFVVFGRLIEIVLGPVPFLLLFFTSGFFGNLFCAIFDHSSVIPHVGASGAIFGMMVFALLSFRKERFGVFFLGTWMQISAAWLILILLSLQLFGFIQGFYEASNVSYLGHLGGAVMGVVWWWMFSRKKIHAFR